MDLNTINISKLPADVRRTYKQLQVLHAEKKIQNRAKDDFLSFVKCVWPEFIEGSHHRLVAEKFNKLATGGIKAVNHQHATPSYKIRICLLSATRVDGGP